MMKWIGCLLLLVIVLATKPNVAADLPNVLLVMTDDQGWGDLSSHGNPHLDTPHLDRLRRQGARLERFFVSPVCAPTRAGLLTGRYPLRTGTHGVTRGQENMRGEEVTLAEWLRANGYATGCFGKWHNGAHAPYHPNSQGFDEFVGFCAGHWNHYFETPLEHNREAIATSGYLPNVLTDRAIEFMVAHREEPFFCYVPLNTPHSPWQVPDAYWNRFASTSLDDKARCAYAMVENIDDNLGRLLDCLDRQGLTQKTIVIFLTDNGPNSDRFNGDMRGRKGSVHEGGSRVPCFVRYPGVIPADTIVSPITAQIDWFPTLAGLTGIPLPSELQLDGRDLTPLLTQGDRVRWSDRTLLVARGKGERGAVRTERWRAVLEAPDLWQLYDMQEDPGETTDVAAQFPQVVQELRSVYESFLDEVRAAELQPLPIFLGLPQVTEVSLLGHEARLQARSAPPTGIGYSQRSGWANDWISHWTDPQALATWDLAPQRTARYRIECEYGLEARQPAELELRVGDERFQVTLPPTGTLETIHGPDRVPRIEVEPRRWARHVLAEVVIAPKVSRLELQHRSASPDCRLELKRLVLVRLD